MICPVCRNVMIIIERERIELDYCPNCSGVWFDAGELELLLERLGHEASNLPVSDILSLPETETTEKKRRCPICRRGMRKVNVGVPQITIDACPQGEGLWFDGGEVDQVIVRCTQKPCPKSEAEGHVMTFLGNTLKSIKKQDS